MTKFIRQISCVLLLSLGVPIYGQSKSVKLDGSDWKQFTESVKVVYVAGFVGAANTLLGEHPTPAKPGTVLGCTAERMGDFRNIKLGQLTDGMDTFYKDYRNQRIRLDIAMFYVRDTITGCSADVLRKELDSLRQEVTD
ncbi:MAG TPA: hypothetical protein VFE22_10810 [Edaphobacter sp.]|nr:hypothetical protein [Edaphobacter sp.]